ncbi:hypothetical protein E2C01_073828 [Portunus trituberculatus]|uniref:Uncharacterized protein n=1 Tax=Portunus trituberculatus TaxID=210409 RepID=A0A5B7ICP7_PORTR|nr:hypothetical protein [Portunus trituberculatus]
MGGEALFPSLGELEHVLTVVGLLAVSKILLQLLWCVGSSVRVHFWSRLWKKRLVEDYGRWAGSVLVRGVSCPALSLGNSKQTRDKPNSNLETLGYFSTLQDRIAPLLFKALLILKGPETLNLVCPQW